MSKYPIYTHTRVLGADIGVWQADEQVAMAGGRAGIRREKRVEVFPTGTRSYISRDERRDLATWARRNGF